MDTQVCRATGQELPLSAFYTQKYTNKDGETIYYIDKKCKAYRRQEQKRRYQTKKAIKAFNAIQESRNKTFFQKVRNFISNLF